MADRRTHYQVLGVARDAPAADVRSAYLRQARRHHPDTAGSDLSAISEAEREMRAINAAWEVLSDPESRRRYDLTLPAPDIAGVTMGEEPDDGRWDYETRVAAEMADSPGVPIGGLAKVLVRAAPVAFVGGFAVLIVSAVLQSSVLWRVALASILFSLVAFLLAPFFVMAASRNNDRL